MLSLVTIAQATPFKVGVASSMTKVKRDISGLEQIRYDNTISIDMAKDESESFQLVLVPQGANLNDISITFKGVNISNNIIFKWYSVGYSKIGKTIYSINDENWVPDPLFQPAALSVISTNLQPIWICVLTNPNTAAGNYNASVEISCGSDIQTMPVLIKVRNFTIPRPGTLATPFGSYRKVLDQWYFGKLGTFPKSEYDKWCNFLAEHRLTPKEAGNDYVVETKKIIDTTTGETTVTNVDMSALKTSLPEITKNYLVDNSYHFYRLPSGSTLTTALNTPGHWWHKTDSLIAPIWKYWAEWKKNNFTDKTYVYGVDEPNSDVCINGCIDIYKAIKTVNPSMKIMQTGNCNIDKFVGLVDIWCPRTERAWLPFFQNRQKEGSILWNYITISTTAPYANFFVDEPGIDHRSLFWQTRKLGATGFLYWATTWVNNYSPQAYQGVTCFPDIPWDYEIAENKQGDGMIVYPGNNFTPIPTIRLEIIRDGIEDYEYFSILKSLIDKIVVTADNINMINNARDLLNIPNSIVTSATVYSTNESIILNYRSQLADAIEGLSQLLVGSQQSPFLINSASDFYALADSVNNRGLDYSGKYFKLTSNIDFHGEKWIPIAGGCSSMDLLGEKVFRGSIDGCGFTVSNFVIDLPASYGVGLIGYMDAGNIDNLNIEEAIIHGCNYVGALIGYSKNDSITTCSSNAQIEGNTFVGGLVGGMFGSTISGCSVKGSVKGVSTVGGIVGQSFLKN